nr:integrase, catalytic region, zinc finger, CCHC-type, peptidase aspartic, catalytic [Tanacetum cinerariifolium]
VVAGLTPEEKERYKADIRATNILLQGSELTKDERESQLYDDFEHFHQNKGETITNTMSVLQNISFNWTPKNKTAQSLPSETNSRIRVIQLILWIVDSGCSKHMTGNLQLLRNFVEKFMGTIRFRKDYFAAITVYRDYVQEMVVVVTDEDE